MKHDKSLMDHQRAELMVFLPEFMGNVQFVASGCWEWVGSRQVRGYGGFGGHGYAYVFSYRAFWGEIPKGKEIHHACFNRACVNPMHLECLTRAEHSAVHGALRMAKPRPTPQQKKIRKERLAMAKLQPVKIWEIIKVKKPLPIKSDK